MDRDGGVRLISIEKLVAGGEGLGRYEEPGADSRDRGKVVLVPGVAPGDRLRVRIVEQRKDFDRGQPVEIVAPGPSRVEPVCPVYSSCGGCTLQHVSYEEQLRQKQTIVHEAFLRVGGVKVETISMVPGAPFGYRNRVQFHRTQEGRPGFKERRSSGTVAISSCPIAHPAINRYLARQTAGAAPERSRYAVVGYGADGGDRIAVEGVDGEVSIELLGKTFFLSPELFFQSNLQQLSRLVPQVIAGLHGDVGADLYAGVGLFSAFLADHLRAVHSVEENGASVAYARRNLQSRSAEDDTARSVAVHHSRVEHWLTRFSRAARAQLDVVVVDPPRAGLSRAVRDLLCQSRATDIRYVSCNPVTLARDAAQFVHFGFAVESCTVFDFYPQTAHVETLLVLRR